MRKIAFDVDEIYEAAVIPERWTAVLESLSNTIEGVGATLFVSDGCDTRWISTPGIMSEGMSIFARNGWSARNTRAAKTAALHRAGFISDLDILSVEEIEKDPMYQQFLYPLGLGWGAGTLIPIPSGDTLVFNVERARERGPVEPLFLQHLNCVRPHLARAALVSARLRLERANAMTQVLEEIGLVGAVIGAKGRVIASSPSLGRINRQIVSRSFGRLALADGSANALLLRAIDTLSSSKPEPRSIVVPPADEQPALVVHVIPIRRSAHDIFASGEALLIFSAVDAARAPSAALLDSLYDLTPSEAGVARSLTRGETVSDIAARTKLSEATIRTHIKAILQKTGLTRQANLVAILGSLGARSPVE